MTLVVVLYVLSLATLLFLVYVLKPWQNDHDFFEEIRHHYENQLSELRDYISENIPNELEKDKSVIKCAIRLLKENKNKDKE